MKNPISDFQSDTSEDSTADKFLDEMDQLNSLNDALQSFSTKNVKVSLYKDPLNLGSNRRSLLQVAKDRKEVFEREEREKAEAQGCDNSIEGSEECHQEKECGIWNLWCVFG